MEIFKIITETLALVVLIAYLIDAWKEKIAVIREMKYIKAWLVMVVLFLAR